MMCLSAFQFCLSLGRLFSQPFPHDKSLLVFPRDTSLGSATQKEENSTSQLQYEKIAEKDSD